jgi:hypothetical protein
MMNLINNFLYFNKIKTMNKKLKSILSILAIIAVTLYFGNYLYGYIAESPDEKRVRELGDQLREINR